MTSEARLCACGFTGGCWFVLCAVAGLAADDLGVFVVKVRVGDVTDSLRSRPILYSMSTLGNSVKGFGESCIKVTDSGLENRQFSYTISQWPLCKISYSY